MSDASPTLTCNAALRYLEKSNLKRVYQETPIVALLGLEDKISAQIDWRNQRRRPVLPNSPEMLDRVRDELSRRDSTELAFGHEEFAKKYKIRTYLPDEGPLRREMYPKHLEFFKAGLSFRERGLFGANRAGKTMCAAGEVSYHVTGRYPDWWPGYRFEEPPDCWIVNKSAKDVRDVNEAELLGMPGDPARRGTGMLPGHLIVSTTPKAGTPNGYEFINVEHVSGATCQIQSKSFDQGREAFQGRSKKLIWLDEECPEPVYTECLLRTMDCDGMILLSYTPLLGLTALTVQYLEDAGISIDKIGKPSEEESYAE